jgi:hypothetical protein
MVAELISYVFIYVQSVFKKQVLQFICMKWVYVVCRHGRKIAESGYQLRHVRLCVCVCVCRSAWNNSTLTRQIFMKFDIWVFFKKIAKKIQVFFKTKQE